MDENSAQRLKFDCIERNNDKAFEIIDKHQEGNDDIVFETVIIHGEKEDDEGCIGKQYYHKESNEELKTTISCSSLELDAITSMYEDCDEALKSTTSASNREYDDDGDDDDSSDAAFITSETIGVDDEEEVNRKWQTRTSTEGGSCDEIITFGMMANTSRNKSDVMPDDEEEGDPTLLKLFSQTNSGNDDVKFETSGESGYGQKLRISTSHDKKYDENVRKTQATFSVYDDSDDEAVDDNGGDDGAFETITSSDEEPGDRATERRRTFDGESIDKVLDDVKNSEEGNDDVTCSTISKSYEVNTDDTGGKTRSVNYGEDADNHFLYTSNLFETLKIPSTAQENGDNQFDTASIEQASVLKGSKSTYETDETPGEYLPEAMEVYKDKTVKEKSASSADGINLMLKELPSYELHGNGESLNMCSKLDSDTGVPKETSLDEVKDNFDGNKPNMEVEDYIENPKELSKSMNDKNETVLSLLSSFTATKIINTGEEDQGYRSNKEFPYIASNKDDYGRVIDKFISHQTSFSEKSVNDEHFESTNFDKDNDKEIPKKQLHKSIHENNRIKADGYGIESADNKVSKEVSDIEGFADNEAPKNFSDGKGFADIECEKEVSDVEGFADNEATKDFSDWEGFADIECAKEMSDVEGFADNEASKELSDGEGFADNEYAKEVSDVEGFVDNKDSKEASDGERLADNEAFKKVSGGEEFDDNEDSKLVSGGVEFAGYGALNEVSDSEGLAFNGTRKAISIAEGFTSKSGIEEVSDSERYTDYESSKLESGVEVHAYDVASQKVSDNDGFESNKGMEEVSFSEGFTWTEGMKKISYSQKFTSLSGMVEVSYGEGITSKEIIEEASLSGQPRSKHGVKETLSGEIFTSTEEVEEVSYGEGSTNRGGLQGVSGGEEFINKQGIEEFSGCEEFINKQGIEEFSGGEEFINKQGIEEVSGGEEFINKQGIEEFSGGIEEFSGGEEFINKQGIEEFSGGEEFINKQGIEEFSGGKEFINKQGIEEFSGGEEFINNECMGELCYGQITTKEGITEVLNGQEFNMEGVSDGQEFTSKEGIEEVTGVGEFTCKRGIEEITFFEDVTSRVRMEGVSGDEKFTSKESLDEVSNAKEFTGTESMKELPCCEEFTNIEDMEENTDCEEFISKEGMEEVTAFEDVISKVGMDEVFSDEEFASKECMEEVTFFEEVTSKEDMQVDMKEITNFKEYTSKGGVREFSSRDEFTGKEGMKELFNSEGLTYKEGIAELPYIEIFTNNNIEEVTDRQEFTSKEGMEELNNFENVTRKKGMAEVTNVEEFPIKEGMRELSADKEFTGKKGLEDLSNSKVFTNKEGSQELPYSEIFTNKNVEEVLGGEEFTNKENMKEVTDVGEFTGKEGMEDVTDGEEITSEEGVEQVSNFGDVSRTEGIEGVTNVEEFTGKESMDELSNNKGFTNEEAIEELSYSITFTNTNTAGEEITRKKGTEEVTDGEEFTSKEGVTEVTDGKEFTSKEGVTEVTDGEEFTSKEGVTEVTDGEEFTSKDGREDITDGEEFPSQKGVTEVTDGEEFISKEGVTEVTDGEEFISKEGVTEVTDGEEFINKGVTKVTDGEEFIRKDNREEIVNGEEFTTKEGVTEVTDGEEFINKEGVTEVTDGEEFISKDNREEIANGEEFTSKEGVTEVTDGEEFTSKEGVTEVTDGEEFTSKEGVTEVTDGEEFTSKEGLTEVTDGEEFMSKEGVTEVTDGEEYMSKEGVTDTTEGEEFTNKEGMKEVREEFISKCMDMEEVTDFKDVSSTEGMEEVTNCEDVTCKKCKGKVTCDEEFIGKEGSEELSNSEGFTNKEGIREIPYSEIFTNEEGKKEVPGGEELTRKTGMEEVNDDKDISSKEVMEEVTNFVDLTSKEGIGDALGGEEFTGKEGVETLSYSGGFTNEKGMEELPYSETFTNKYGEEVTSGEEFTSEEGMKEVTGGVELIRTEGMDEVTDDEEIIRKEGMEEVTGGVELIRTEGMEEVTADEEIIRKECMEEVTDDEDIIRKEVMKEVTDDEEIIRKEVMEEVTDDEDIIRKEVMEEVTDDEEIMEEVTDNEEIIRKEGMEEVTGGVELVSKEGMKEVTGDEEIIRKEGMEEVTGGVELIRTEGMDEVTDDEEIIRKEGMEEVTDDEDIIRKEVMKEVTVDEDIIRKELMEEVTDDEEINRKEGMKKVTEDEEIIRKEGMEEVTDDEEIIRKEGMEESGGEEYADDEKSEVVSDGEESAENQVIKPESGGEEFDDERKSEVVSDGEESAENEALKLEPDDKIYADDEKPKVMPDSKILVENEGPKLASSNEGTAEIEVPKLEFGGEEYSEKGASKVVSAVEGSVENKVLKAASECEGFAENGNSKMGSNKERSNEIKFPNEVFDGEKCADNEARKEVSDVVGITIKGSIKGFSDKENYPDFEASKRVADFEGFTGKQSDEACDGKENSDSEASREVSDIEGYADNETSREGSGNTEYTDNECVSDFRKYTDARIFSGVEVNVDNEAVKESSDVLKGGTEEANERRKDMHIIKDGDNVNSPMKLSESNEDNNNCGTRVEVIDTDEYDCHKTLKAVTNTEESDYNGSLRPPTNYKNRNYGLSKELSSDDPVNDDEKILSELHNSEIVENKSLTNAAYKDKDNETLESPESKRDNSIEDPEESLMKVVKRDHETFMAMSIHGKDDHYGALSKPPKTDNDESDGEYNDPPVCGKEDVNEEALVDLSYNKEEVHSKVLEVFKSVADDGSGVFKVSDGEALENLSNFEIDNEHGCLKKLGDFEVQNESEIPNDLIESLRQSRQASRRKVHVQSFRRSVSSHIRSATGTHPVKTSLSDSECSKGINVFTHENKNMLEKDKIITSKRNEEEQPFCSTTDVTTEGFVVDGNTDDVLIATEKGARNEMEMALCQSSPTSRDHSCVISTPNLKQLNKVEDLRAQIKETYQTRPGVHESFVGTRDSELSYKFEAGCGGRDILKARTEEALTNDKEAGPIDNQPFIGNNILKANIGQIDGNSYQSHSKTSVDQHEPNQEVSAWGGIAGTFVERKLEEVLSPNENIQLINTDQSKEQFLESFLDVDIIDLKTDQRKNDFNEGFIGDDILMPNVDQTEIDYEVSRCSQESSQPDATEFEESNLSSEDGALEADISSFDSTLLAPSSGEKRKAKGKKGQTLKYCMLASARKSTGSKVSLPKFYAIYSSESGEDYSEKWNIDAAADVSDSGSEPESQRPVQEVSTERQNPDSLVSESLLVNQCLLQVENISDTPPEPYETSADIIRHGSIRVRKDRYSSFFGFSSAGSIEPFKDPLDHDAKFGSFILPTNASSGCPIVTGLPPKSQRKKPKQIPLRIACLEKATNFSPKKLSSTSTQKNSNKHYDRDSNQSTELDFLEEVDDPTQNSSGSIQLDSMYYTDSCDSPSLVEDKITSQLFQPRDTSDQIDQSLTQKLGDSARVYQVPQARKNLEHLFSTPIQAASVTPESDSELYKVSPIYNDPVDTALHDATDAEGGAVRVDVLGVSGLEVFSDTNSFVASDTESLKTTTNCLPAAQSSGAALNNTGKSPKKSVTFLLPQADSKSFEATQDLDIGNCRTVLKSRIDKFPISNSLGQYRPVQVSSSDKSLETKDYSDGYFETQDKDCEYNTVDVHRACQSLEINYDPFMAGRVGELLSKSPRLSVIMEEEQETASTENTLELSATLSLSTTDGSLEVSPPTTEGNRACYFRDYVGLDPDRIVTAENTKNLETESCVKSTAEAFQCRFQTSSYINAHQHDTMDKTKDVISEVVSEIANGYMDSNMLEKTAASPVNIESSQDIEYRTDSFPSDFVSLGNLSTEKTSDPQSALDHSLKLHCDADKTSLGTGVETSCFTKPLPEDGTGWDHFEADLRQEATSLKNDFLTAETKQNGENIQIVELTVDDTSSKDTIHLNLCVDVEGLEACNCLCTCELPDPSKNLILENPQEVRLSPMPEVNAPNSHPFRLQQEKGNETISSEELFRNLQIDCERFLNKRDRENTTERNLLPVQSDRGMWSENLFHPPWQQCLKPLHEPKLSRDVLTDTKSDLADNACLTYDEAFLKAAEPEAVPVSVRKPLLSWKALSDDEEDTGPPPNSHNDSLVVENLYTSKEILPKNLTNNVTQRIKKGRCNGKNVNRGILSPDGSDSDKETQTVFEDENCVSEAVSVKGASSTIDISSEPCYERCSAEGVSDKSSAGKEDGTQHPTDIDTSVMLDESSYSNEFAQNDVSSFSLMNKGYYTLEVTFEGGDHVPSRTSCIEDSKFDSSYKQLDLSESSEDEASMVEFDVAFHEDKSPALRTPLCLIGNRDSERDTGGYIYRRCPGNVEKYSSEGNVLDISCPQIRGSSQTCPNGYADTNYRTTDDPTPVLGSNNVIIANANSSYLDRGDQLSMFETDIDEMIAVGRSLCNAPISSLDEDVEAEYLDDYTENMDDFDVDFRTELVSRKLSSESSASDPDILSYTSSTISDPAMLAGLRVDTGYCGNIRANRPESLDEVKAKECQTVSQEGITHGITDWNVDENSCQGDADERCGFRVSVYPESGPFELNINNSNTHFISGYQRSGMGHKKHGDCDRDKASDKEEGDQTECGYTSSTDGQACSSSGLLGQSDLCDSDDLFSVSEFDLARLEETGRENETLDDLPERAVNVHKQRIRYHKFFIGNCDPDPSYGLKEECREWSWFVDREPNDVEDTKSCVEHLGQTSCDLANLNGDHVICSPACSTLKHRDKNLSTLFSTEINEPPLSPADSSLSPDTFCSEHQDHSKGPDNNFQLQWRKCSSQRVVTHRDNNCGPSEASESDTVGVRRLSPLVCLENHGGNLSLSDSRLSTSPPEEARGNACPKPCPLRGSPPDCQLVSKLRGELSSVEASPVEANSSSTLDISPATISCNKTFLRQKCLKDPIDPYFPSEIDLEPSNLSVNFIDSDNELIENDQVPSLPHIFVSEDPDPNMVSIMSKRRAATRQKSFRDLIGIPMAFQRHLELINQDALETYDLTKLLREIMQEARNLTDAERCSVFLIDNDTDELVAMVFDGITADDKEVQGEIRLPKTQGIAGHVATTGTLLNIRDAYSHPLFYRGIDDSTGFRTRNILCFPIKDEEGVVLGVAQLCNKKTFQYFTTFDEDIASAFAVYCCISISHSLMYKKLVDTQNRHRIANELVIFHINQVDLIICVIIFLVTAC
ncbi:cGMP-dependent 3',5'-cyclic phosphodiesterase-like [Elysia marginata]|uniref:cGMP-dependent 3',5'-cyclic phosphodiesterase-like n=1 Tax=Elysia marginata TaxID=1093978 RepID=A0AAV4G387_9GAST|nr:cGMP-dependent 3',5'-cyclic phosphodiesterase-like [Elysia marginata]